MIPLLAREPATAGLIAVLRDDEYMIVSRETRVECISALAHRRREGGLDADGESQARAALSLFESAWSEVQPTDRVRSLAERLLAVHPLRAADAIQLASSLVWCEGTPDQRPLVCLDHRLRDAARKEGFTLQQK